MKTARVCLGACVVAMFALLFAPTNASAQCMINCPAGDNAVIDPSAPFSDKSVDLDQNGVINLVDFVLFAGVFLTNDFCADFNCNGVVDLADYVIFSAHFGHAGNFPLQCI